MSNYLIIYRVMYDNYFQNRFVKHQLFRVLENVQFLKKKIDFNAPTLNSRNRPPFAVIRCSSDLTAADCPEYRFSNHCK